jgi:hypothetical protein
VDIEGRTFKDADGRTLMVHEYNPGDGLGREIVGTLLSPPTTVHDVLPLTGTTTTSATQPYATDVKTFKAIWLEGAAPHDGKGSQYG